jgi:hypothetical protein
MQGLVSVRNTLSSESGGVRTEHRSLQEGNQRQIRRKKNRETFAGGTHDAINRNRTTSFVRFKDYTQPVSSRRASLGAFRDSRSEIVATPRPGPLLPKKPARLRNGSGSVAK